MHGLRMVGFAVALVAGLVCTGAGRPADGAATAGPVAAAPAVSSAGGPVSVATPAGPASGPRAPGQDAAPTRVPGTPCLSTARACIDLSANRSWLISGGAIAYGPVPITHGRAGWRTPPGTFRVTFKDRDHRSALFGGAPMPNSVFFNGGIAFHQGSLSVPSHGCVHLSKAASLVYFASLQRGDVVQVVP